MNSFGDVDEIFESLVPVVGQGSKPSTKEVAVIFCQPTGCVEQLSWNVCSTQYSYIYNFVKNSVQRLGYLSIDGLVVNIRVEQLLGWVYFGG